MCQAVVKWSLKTCTGGGCVTEGFATWLECVEDCTEGWDVTELSEDVKDAMICYCCGLH